MIKMKYCEDLLEKWDKRMQIEGILFFFFSCVSGSSFVSLYMFESKYAILYLLPFLYIICMLCWWYLCQKIVFETKKSLNNNTVKYVFYLSLFLWLIITFCVSLGSFDEFKFIKWNQNSIYPKTDNIYRLFNCILIFGYLGILFYDYYKEINDRMSRIKFWMLFIFMHQFIGFTYFIEYVIDIYKVNSIESSFARWLAMIGCLLSIIISIIVFCSKKMRLPYVIILFLGILCYWCGSSSLDCEFYADTADVCLTNTHPYIYIHIGKQYINIL